MGSLFWGSSHNHCSARNLVAIASWPKSQRRSKLSRPDCGKMQHRKEHSAVLMLTFGSNSMSSQLCCLDSLGGVHQGVTHRNSLCRSMLQAHLCCRQSTDTSSESTSARSSFQLLQLYTPTVHAKHQRMLVCPKHVRNSFWQEHCKYDSREQAVQHLDQHDGADTAGCRLHTADYTCWSVQPSVKMFSFQSETCRCRQLCEACILLCQHHCFGSGATLPVHGIVLGYLSKLCWSGHTHKCGLSAAQQPQLCF